VKISKPSKSARKREFQAVQVLGEQLIELTDEQLGGLDLDESLFDAVVAAKAIKSHSALRRQKQLIGKLMRGTDPVPIQAKLDSLGRHGRVEKDIFRQAELWRDRIANEGTEALSGLFTALGRENKDLSEYTKAHLAAPNDTVRRQTLRKIFREIHKELSAKMQNTAH
jgi:ribosome-associated protein